MPYIKRCPECNSINLTYDEQKGEVICNDCGLIVEEKMVYTGHDEAGKFDKSEKKGRGGAPLSIQKFDFSDSKNGRKGFQHLLKETLDLQWLN